MKVTIITTTLCAACFILSGLYIRTWFALESANAELLQRKSLSNPEMTAMRGWSIVADAYYITYRENLEIVDTLKQTRLSCTELLPHLKSKTALNPLGIDFSKRTMISQDTWNRIEEFGQILPGSETLLGRLVILGNNKQPQ